MTGSLIVLAFKSDRDQAHAWIDDAPVNSRVTFARPKRSLPQNDALWAQLDRISRKVCWHGQYYPKETWRDLFMHSLTGATFVPGIDGGMVPVGRHTSTLAKDQFSALLDIVTEWSIRNGVEVKERTEPPVHNEFEHDDEIVERLRENRDLMGK